MRRRFAAAVLSALVFVAVGCGSSSSDKGPTKAEYITKADAICKAGNAQLRIAIQGAGSSPTAAQVKALATSVFIPNLEGQLKSLRALKPPKADKATVKSLLDGLETAIGKLKADPSQLAASGGGPFAAVNAQANSYGLKACGAG